MGGLVVLLKKWVDWNGRPVIGGLVIGGLMDVVGGLLLDWTELVLFWTGLVLNWTDTRLN